MFGHHRHASESPFKWRFAGEPMMAHAKWYLDHLSRHHLKIVVKVGPPLTKLSGSAHIGAARSLMLIYCCAMCGRDSSADPLSCVLIFRDFTAHGKSTFGFC